MITTVFARRWCFCDFNDAIGVGCPRAVRGARCRPACFERERWKHACPDTIVARLLWLLSLGCYLLDVVLSSDLCGVRIWYVDGDIDAVGGPRAPENLYTVRKGP